MGKPMVNLGSPNGIHAGFSRLPCNELGDAPNARAHAGGGDDTTTLRQVGHWCHVGHPGYHKPTIKLGDTGGLSVYTTHKKH